MRKLALALGFLLCLSVGALAQGCGPQNPNCIVPTAPFGTNNNQAASTAFVQAAIAALIPFPTPTRAGDIIYWNGTAWTTLAGNNSGTGLLTEGSSGTPSWTAIGTSGAVIPLLNGANTWSGLQALGAGFTFASTGTTQGFLGTQIGTGTISVSRHTFDEIDFSDHYAAGSNAVVGLYLNSNILSSATGFHSTFSSEIDFQASGITTGGDLEAGIFTGFAVQPNGGSSPSTYAGTMFGTANLCNLQSGATYWLICTGAEFQAIIGTGANAQARFGVTVASNGNLQADNSGQYDAGIGFYSYSSTGWQYGIQFTNLVGSNAPLSSTATIFGTDGSSDTVGSFADFHTYTISNYIMNFANYTVTGAGAVTKGTWNGSVVGLAYGGTGANITASNHALIVSSSSALATAADITWNNDVLSATSTNAFGPQAILTNTDNVATAGFFILQKSRSGGVIQSLDALGSFSWAGYTNGAYHSLANITVTVAGSITGNDIPSYINFETDSGTALGQVAQLGQGLSLGTTTDPGFGSIMVNNHYRSNGTAPTLGACGTSPSISGTDFAGKITVGTDTVTSCTITFAATYTTAPGCTVSSGTAITSPTVTTTATTLVIGGSSLTSDVLTYICGGTSFLLRRDLDPAANDNSPLFLEKVG